MSSQVAIVQTKDGNTDPKSKALASSSFLPAYFFVSASTIWAAALSLYFFAVIGALLTTVILGRVAIWPWPELSAIWTAKPGMRIVGMLEEQSAGRIFSLSFALPLFLYRLIAALGPVFWPYAVMMEHTPALARLPTGNFFSRWSLVQGGALFAISQVGRKIALCSVHVNQCPLP